MDYVKAYDAHLNFFHNLVAIDGPARKATFEVKAARYRAGTRRGRRST